MAAVAPSQIRPIQGMGKLMAAALPKSNTKPASPRARAQDVDRHVGARMRDRRVMLGLTQQHMAELIGVTSTNQQKKLEGNAAVATWFLRSGVAESSAECLV